MIDRNKWFAAVLILVLSCGARQASGMDLEMTTAEIHATPGTQLVIRARIHNDLQEDPLFLTGISSSVPPALAGADHFDEFGTSVPRRLSPGEIWEGPILRLTIPANGPIPAGLFVVTIMGGLHDRATDMQSSAAFSVDSATVVSVPTPAAAMQELRVAPNPFKDMTALSFALARESRVQAAIFDVSGRRVRQVFMGALGAGAHHLNWDGLDDAGKRARPGIFFIRIATGQSVMVTPVVLIE